MGYESAVAGPRGDSQLWGIRAESQAVPGSNISLPPEDGRDPPLAGCSGSASLVSALRLHGAVCRRHGRKTSVALSGKRGLLPPPYQPLLPVRSADDQAFEAACWSETEGEALP